MADRKQLSTYVPEEFHAWFTAEADRLSLSNAEYFRRILELWRTNAEAEDGALVNSPALGSEGVVDALAELREYIATEFASVRATQDKRRWSWWPFRKA